IIYNFLEPYEEKTSYTFLGGVLFIYPNEPFIESLQLMFDPDEREEIFVKWNQIYLNVPAILYFLEKGAQPTGTVHDISKKAGIEKDQVNK
ncbi:hypothetical protein Prudu_006152, partial [Prunus dulcis]